jgi:hypothetical protein
MRDVPRHPISFSPREQQHEVAASVAERNIMECGQVHSTLLFAALMVGVQRAISLLTQRMRDGA